MTKSFERKIVEASSIMFHLYEDSEQRDRKMILAMAFMVYLSSGLAGYAMYTSIYFLLDHKLIALLIGVCTSVFMVLHDQSLLATDRNRQIYVKILISGFLAVGFTLTNNASAEYETLSQELQQTTAKQNANTTIELNQAIEAIEKEEREILERIEIAGARINETKQPLIDARRSYSAFTGSKDERIQRIRDAYAPKFVEAQINDFAILTQQAKKFASGGEGTFIAVLLAFLFFIIESLPAILRIMLDDGDYMKRFLASLYVMRELRDQRISQQLNFASADSDILSNILQLEIISEKNDLVATNFTDTERMLVLDQRQKILDAGYNPYTGKRLDYIDLSFFENMEGGSKDEQDQEDMEKSVKTKNEEQEPVFDL
jgi:hypothetical protein